MRHRSLMAAMRGKDGRSLARALVVLVLLAVFAGGLNTGAVAGSAAVICKAGDDGSPSPAHVAVDCCLAGVTPLGMALAPGAPAAGVPAVPVVLGAPLADATAVTGLARPAALARGPPSLA